MKYSHIIQKVYFDPVIMTPRAHASIRAIIEKHLSDDMESPDIEDELDIFGQKLPSPYKIDNIEVIPVYGTIGYKVGMLEKSCGVTDVRDIKSWYDKALNDESVSAILFDIDSPGGFVTGVPELAKYIAKQKDRKPVCAYTDGCMASAAYWIGCATGTIFARESADIGSIGAYSYFLDTSRMYESVGVKIDLFTSGKYKGMMLDGLALTEEQKKLMSDGVTEIANTFKNFVKSNRSNLDPEVMEGQSFSGTKANENNLVDILVEDINEVVQYLKDL